MEAHNSSSTESESEAIEDTAEEMADAGKGPDDDKDRSAADNNSVPSTTGEPSAPTGNDVHPRKLSAKERRLRGRKTSAGTHDESGEETKPGNNNRDRSAGRSGAAQPLPRGKRGKQKKAAKKYADQDDEDRRLAMAALGNPMGLSIAELEASGKKKHKKKLQKLKQKEARERAAKHRQEQQDGFRSGAHASAHESGSKPALGAPANKDDNPDDDEAGLDEMEVSESALRSFTASPQPHDVVLYAIPFCGPMSSMLHFKYRAKLTPGSLKKGKASQTVVHLFTSAKACTAREKELIGSIPDNELTAVMPPNIKVSAPGLSQAARKSPAN